MRFPFFKVFLALKCEIIRLSNGQSNSEICDVHRKGVLKMAGGCLPISLIFTLSSFTLAFFSSHVSAKDCPERIDAEVLCFAETPTKVEPLLKSASPTAQTIYQNVRNISAAAEYINGLPSTNAYQAALKSKCYNEKMGDFFAKVTEACRAATDNCLNCPNQGDLKVCLRLMSSDTQSSDERAARVTKLSISMSQHRTTAVDSETTEIALSPNGAPTLCNGIVGALKSGTMKLNVGGAESNLAKPANANVPIQVLTTEELPPPRPSELKNPKTIAPTELTPAQALKALPTLQQIDATTQKGVRTPSALKNSGSPSPTNCPEWAPYDSFSGGCNTGD